MQEAHHLTVCCFAPGVLRRQAPGNGKSTLVLAARLQRVGQLSQQIEQALMKALPLEQNPILVITHQEIAAIELHSLEPGA